jgi:hypothetical protein
VELCINYFSLEKLPLPNTTKMRVTHGTLGTHVTFVTCGTLATHETYAGENDLSTKKMGCRWFLCKMK